MNVKCPTCGKSILWEETATRPFCSDRCRLLDLGRWLNEDYAVECDEPAEDPDTPEIS